MEILSLERAVFIRLILRNYVLANDRVWLETSDGKIFIGSITNTETKKFLVKNKPVEIPVQFIFKPKDNRKKEIVIDPFKIVKVRLESEPEERTLKMYQD